MAVVFRFLKKYRVAAIAALLMMLIELTVELIQPLLISKIIDHGIQQRNLTVVWMWGGVLLGSALIAFLAGIASSFLASHASQGFGHDLRGRLYDKVQSFSYTVFNKFASSSLITRLTGDVTQVQDMVFMTLRFMSRVPLVVLGSIIMALVVHLQLGLLLAVTVPVLLVFMIWLMRRAAVMFRSVQRRLDAVNGVIQENLTGIRLIRVFVRTAYEAARFAEFSGRLMKKTVSALRLTEATTPFILLIMNAGIIAVLWFGRGDIAEGNASVGEVVAVVNYSLRTIGALSAVSWLVVAFSRARASAQRIEEVFQTEELQELAQAEQQPETRIGQAPAAVSAGIDGGVEFHQVGFHYPGSDIAVLQDISFKAAPGGRIAIMGATGSGKSSLVQLIPRLYEPDSGKVLIDGCEASGINLEQLRGAIGYVPQEVLLFTGSVRDNIAWGNENATKEEIQQAAKRAQIHDTIQALPNGYDTMLGQRGVNLSGGQKQRISIARALVRKPSILILDDSTSALDVRTEAALLDALTELSCTTFLITQKISSTVSADLILLLDEGRLIGQGHHEKLLRESGLYRRIYESQYGEESKHA
ncbi:ABC transporter ATP-binding protein [Paenibacillus sp. JX-17]|uniref:ABC transporter ATP-binding protein n=1 Tax=Paenibacillus lacisoli TaxID=3064525 RepID=A0ABT9CHZ8_9BACL|nr:ABC transporter ATP-binding protein [Paenibacillus sp. JX-17]MDO7908836.1 ABC transporter ATP-binding protein [Paenibacillus sp. JX-17]